MQPDRRIRRSLRPEEALQFFLEAARERLGVRTLTVGTTEGALLAGAGVQPKTIAKRGARVDARGVVKDTDVATWRTRVGDRDLVLTSWGRAMTPDLATGVRRILESH